ncbi:formylmethanofuran dehydrogenase [uncultured Methylibium sp.]|uniref:formylmethanofuran dehydrogenase n=1 Tax=uncultured Methylibium sp. TaxID=381093 RepID=UPI0026015820|nr:formylmethanofuran dehydrogenase [uncultured Methylibium sp.]
MSPTPSAATPWTCPFCPLLCDGYALAQGPDGLALVGSDCPRAAASLARCASATVTPTIDGQPASADAALDAAARLLAAARQPLFGGLGTDVDGARALYPLACATGAISDAAGGEALLHTLRALQDRGQFTTTLAEVRNRADLIVCIGESPRENLPEIWRRLGVGRGDDERLVAQREIVFIGAPADPVLAGRAGIDASSVPLQGDLFDTVALLAACIAQRRVAAPPAIAALAERLRAARYAVLMFESKRLPAQGTLIVEALNQAVATLNRSTRAALLPLGGGDGASSVNQTWTWLSGLPLRSRAGPLGLEHEPLRYGAQALIDDGAVDALLWVASFGTEPPCPPGALPTVVLGGPGVAAPARGVFIPVATPGLGGSGHLFRTDSSVVLPLEPVRDDGLPGVADVAKALTARVRALKT